MDYLEQRKLIKPWSRSRLLGNKLVLIAPALNRAVRLAIEPGPLAIALGNGRLAMADPASVPAGMYAGGAREPRYLARRREPHRRRRERAGRAVVSGSRRGTLGIVYATDTAVEPVRSLPPFRRRHIPHHYPGRSDLDLENPYTRLTRLSPMHGGSRRIPEGGFRVLEQPPATGAFVSSSPPIAAARRPGRGSGRRRVRRGPNRAIVSCVN
jgi:hypothetical protein